ncbi:class I SAM-dependent methyltransferase [Nocardioides aurantiacus]|uniref:class I SAM-dependent methyltransferase n=1 Tax=Nocardioides aurantiacus TaxID=86796 RepID=UPI000F46959C|nr:class I SAM-dependent methyltransferase [Nocardioides aurantiacus]
MTNLTRTPSPGPVPQVRQDDGPGLLDALREAHRGAGPLPALAPDGYARDHAAFEARSDQRALIADHLCSRLAGRPNGPVSVLSVGCGDGALDVRVAARAVAARPARPVRYVGVDPWAGSADSWAAAMAGLRCDALSAESQVATFADARLTGRFDVVTFVHSMYYVPDVAAALRAAYDLLRPGGELLVLSGPRGVLNALTDVLAPPVAGHRQWFSEDVARGLADAGLRPEPTTTLAARLDLVGASDRVLDFTVQGRLTPRLRPLVREYLAAVARTDPAYDGPRVPHPVDVHRVVRAA